MPEEPHKKIRITKRQRSVLKLLRASAIITKPHPKNKFRLLDNERRPLSYVHGRTFNAMQNKSLIIKQKDGSYTAVCLHKWVGE